MADQSLSTSPPITPQPLVPYHQDIPETVLELRHLTTALSAFHRRYDDLQSHLNFISSSIDALLNPNSKALPSISDQTLVLEQSIVSPSENPPILSPEETLISKKYLSPDQTLVLEQSTVCPSEKSPIFTPEETLISKKDLSSDQTLISPPGENIISKNPQNFTTNKALVLEKTLIKVQTLGPFQFSKKRKAPRRPPRENFVIFPISHLGETLISENPPNFTTNEALVLEKAPILEQALVPSPFEKSVISEKSPISHPKENPTSKKSPISHLGVTLTSKQPQISPTEKTLVSEKALTEEQDLNQSEIVSLCKSMKGNSLRKYLLSRLSELKNLLEEVPAALKQCPNPTKLVLDCIGQFYLLGAKAQHKTQSLNRSRIVNIVMLECFLMTECEVSESEIKGLAETAMKWRERMMNEGGIGIASEIDAKGLLLFVGCFGIPDDFKDDDVLDLFRVSKGKDFLDLLRRSKILIGKITEIIKAKEKENRDLEALDIAFTFGPEVNYSPKRSVSNFLRNSKKSWDAAQKLVHDLELDQAIILFKNQLVDLNSLLKCLEEHKVDPSSLLPNWDPNKRMGQIKHELAELAKRLEKREQKLLTKRKADQSEPSKKPNEKKMKEAHPSQGLEQQKAANFMNKSPPGKVLLPRVEDALAIERFVGRGLGGPERLVSPSRFECERFVGPSHIGPERFLGPSYIKPEREMFLGPSHIGPERERFLGPIHIGPERFVSPRGIGREKLVGQCHIGPDRYLGPSHIGPDRFVSPSGIEHERFVSPSVIGPEKLVGPSHIGPERYLGPSDIGPERFVSPSGIERGRNVGPSGIGPEKYVGRSYADLYMRYSKPLPSGSSGLSGLGSKSELYGFADAVMEREANSSGPSAPFTHHRPHHRY